MIDDLVYVSSLEVKIYKSNPNVLVTYIYF